MIEYKMSKEMAKAILSLKQRKSFKGSNQDWLCKYVNEEINPLRTCVKVLISG